MEYYIYERNLPNMMKLPEEAAKLLMRGDHYDISNTTYEVVKRVFRDGICEIHCITE